MTVDNAGPSPLELIESALNTINHMLIGSVTIYVVWLYISIPYEIYNLHSIFGCLAYQFFMAEAILVFYQHNSWTQQLSRRAKGWIHGVLQVLASSCAFAGIIVELYVHDWMLLWNSNHVFLGLTATLFLILNVILGVVVFYSGSAAVRKIANPLYLKFMHNLIGITCFVIGMTTLYFGFGRNFMMIDFVNDEVRAGLRAGTLTSAILTSLGAFRTLYFQFNGCVKLIRK